MIMFRFVLLISLSLCFGLECPVRLLYSNETQAASVDEYGATMESLTHGLDIYFEPKNTRCWQPPTQVRLACDGISGGPYLEPYREYDHILILHMTAQCASWHSEWDNYIRLGDDKYLPLGNVCTPTVDGLNCFGDIPLNIRG